MIELPYNDLDTIQTDNGRFYITPDGNHYHSVTTFLKHFQDLSFLEDWKERVGEDEAHRISTGSSSRGDIVHELCEKYLNGESIQKNDYFPSYYMMFRSMVPLLDRVTPYGQEKAVYSDRFKLAGRVDCIGLFDGVPSIIDFKTSGKIKFQNWIKNYFLQVSIYSYIVEELTGFSAKQIVIIMGVYNRDPQLFIKDRIKYRNEIRDMVRKFWKS